MQARICLLCKEIKNRKCVAKREKLWTNFHFNFSVIHDISQRHYRSFWHAIAEHVAEDEERIDEDIAGDRNVNSGGVIQLESWPVEDFLERVHRIDRQTDRENGHYLHRMKSVT